MFKIKILSSLLHMPNLTSCTPYAKWCRKFDISLGQLVLVRELFRIVGTWHHPSGFESSVGDTLKLPWVGKGATCRGHFGLSLSLSYFYYWLLSQCLVWLSNLMSGWFRISRLGSLGFVIYCDTSLVIYYDTSHRPIQFMRIYNYFIMWYNV